MKLVTVDGNEACSNTAYMFTEVAGIYPITPASPMAEHVDEWSNKGVLNIFNDEVKVEDVPEPKKCSNCGEVVIGKYCSNCGTKIEE